ncbi:UPF0225 protein YchJ [Pseudoalteromonas luteoviolacea B = ATCC 29581]|nr:UPF0225 protein YchJ [Pseudoalteromonas luteoviolacea B = ATCC 29581]
MHSGLALPKSAEALMRSRYCAYVLKNAEYILDTYSKLEQAHHSVEDISAFADSCKFLRLEIVDSSHNVVEFKAFYCVGHTVGILHERSNFELEGERWKYKDGELFSHPEMKLSRNDPCPCKSGKKFKQCHLKS